MAFLQRLKAWGAVEKNGRRLYLIHSFIGAGFFVGFGLLDILLSRLQHDNLAPVQRMACALQWVNVVTVHLIPTHIQDYVEWHCANSEISIPTIARIYFMTKTTATIISSVIVTSLYIYLIISGNNLFMKNLYSDLNINLSIVLIYNTKKLLVKLIILVLPGVFLLIYVSLYFVFYIDKLKNIDFIVNIMSTSGLWFCMLIPSGIVKSIYLAARLMSNDKPIK